MEGEEALMRANATKERVLAIFFKNTALVKNICQNIFNHEVHLPFVLVLSMIPLPAVYFLITDEHNHRFFPRTNSYVTLYTPFSGDSLVPNLSKSL